MPYLMLDGAKQFIDFTKAVFNAELIYHSTRDDSDGIMHAEIMIGGCTIMFTDTTAQWPTQTANLFIYVVDADATYALSLKHGAESVSEPANQSYGRACGVKDPLGNTWWITSVL